MTTKNQDWDWSPHTLRLAALTTQIYPTDSALGWSTFQDWPIKKLKPFIKTKKRILLDRFWLRTQPQATSKVLEVAFMQKKLSEAIVCGVTDCRVTLEGKSERKQTLIIRNVDSQQVQSYA